MGDGFYRVDLRDPGTLRSVLDGYLRLKVCPVEADQRPPLLYPTTVEIQLPDGSTMTRWGIVIRYLEGTGFLVQFEGPLDLTTLNKLAELSVGPHSEQVPPDDAPVPDDVFVPDPDFEPEADFDDVTRPAPEAPADEGSKPRFGPTASAFVAGPDPDSPPEPPDEPSAFEGDETPLHEAVKALLEAVNEEPIETKDDMGEAEGEDDSSAEPVRDAGPVPSADSEEEVEQGIPEGWTLTETQSPLDDQIDEADEADEGDEGDEGDEEAETAAVRDAVPLSVPVGLNRESRPSKVAVQERSAIYKQIEAMSLTEKQRLARSCNRITRGLLIKDRIKKIHQFVLRNPKVTIEEVVEFAKLPSLSKDAIRIIAANRTWLSSRQIVLGLVKNPGTPVDLLPGLLQRLGPHQWKLLAKSGDVRVQVSTLAKKLMLTSRR